MMINKIFGEVKTPRRADKAAVGAINRPLRMDQVLCERS